MLGLAALIPVFVFPIVGGPVAEAMERRRLISITGSVCAGRSWTGTRMGSRGCSPSS
jgi:hypothetical protein